MKTKYLLPHRFLYLGWFLIMVFVPLALWMLFSPDTFPFSLEMEISPIYADTFGFSDLSLGSGIVTHIFNFEVVALGVIPGFFLAGFSRLKTEDERIAQMRLESLQWGIYTNYLVLTLCIILVYGGAFLAIMIYNIFTPLLIFVLRFYWLLYVKPAIEARKERSLSL